MGKGRHKVHGIGHTHDVQNTSSLSYMPKPVLRRLGNPKRITFTIHDDHIAVAGPDD